MRSADRSAGDPDAAPLGFWPVAAADPSRIAVIDAHGTEISFGALLDRSRAVSAALAELGLERGDAVAVVLANTPTFFAVNLAAMESGLYLTPVNSHLAPPEIAHVVADCEAEVLVVDETSAEASRPGAERAAIDEDHRFVDGEAQGYRSLAELVERGASLDQPPRSPGTVMMYTSGTTGTPKGVRRALPEGDPDAVFGPPSRVYCDGFGMPIGAATHLVCGPLYHAGPYASASNALHAGNTVVLMERWDAEAFLALVERHRVASTQMVPTMFHRLLALPDEVKRRYDVSSLRSVMHTGAPCPAHVKQRLMDWLGPVVYETYGGTESVATIAKPHRWLERPGTVGKPIHGVTVHIVGDDGEELPVGAVGEIYIQNRHRPDAEYFKDPEKTARMRRGGRVTLGDMGFLDEDGYLFLSDRSVDMVISGGVNIYPAEIESVLLEHPDVVDVAVIGIPDDEWGERVLAIVEPRSGVDAAELPGELDAFCAGRLARFKQPRQYEVVPELPRLPNGKIQKRTLRAPYWEATERAI